MSRVLESLPLDRIRIDGGTQPRAQLDPTTIQNYAEAMSRGEMFPPLIVFHDGETYWLADGFHRLQAAKDSTTHPEPEIDCEIKQGTQRDAVLFSAGANATHGLPRSNEDKRRAVMRLLSDDEWSAWSDRRIADVCHVDHKTVGKYRAELGKFPSKRKYIKDGTESTMDTSKIAESNVERAAQEPAGEESAPSDLAPLILTILKDGPKRMTQLLVRIRQEPDRPDGQISDALSQALFQLIKEKKIVRTGGQGTGKAVEYALVPDATKPQRMPPDEFKAANGDKGIPTPPPAPTRDEILAAAAGATEESLRAAWKGENVRTTPIHQQLINEGLIRPVTKWSSGAQYNVGFVKVEPATQQRSVIAVMKTDPGKPWTVPALLIETGLSEQAVKNELIAAKGYGAVREDQGYYILTTTEAKHAQDVGQGDPVDQIDPETAEVTQIAVPPEREPDPDRPVDPVHMNNPLIAGDEWGYLDQRPIRVVMNVITELEAIEDALKALDGQEFLLALAHTPSYPTARQVKKADETALRVCGQLARLDVICANFARQQAAQKAESEQPAEPVSDTTADAETGQQPEAVT